MHRPDKPALTVARAKQLRQAMSLPEVLLWRELRAAPGGMRFRKQHPAGHFVLDFFCARANLAIEIDGTAHDMGERAHRDEARDAWLLAHRITTVRIAASEVLRDPGAVAQSIVAAAVERLERFGKTPPSVLRLATSPSQDVGEDHLNSAPSACDRAVASRSDDGGVT